MQFRLASLWQMDSRWCFDIRRYHIIFRHHVSIDFLATSIRNLHPHPISQTKPNLTNPRCISRRRRRRNQIGSTNQSMAYTQPAATYGQAPASYNYSQPQQSYAPPAGAPPTYGGGHAGANADYYGTSGVTQPANTYAK